MKIIIVGAGVSGLATYLQLTQQLPRILKAEIIIYESRLDANYASSAPMDADDILSDSTAVVGNSIILPPTSIRLLRRISPDLYSRFKSRGFENHAFTIASARGHTIARISTHDGISPREWPISCPRWVLWECLRDTVGKGRITLGKVIRVDINGERPAVHLQDGRSETADLVVGADGVHSVVKRALFGTADAFAPQFEGYRGVGSFLNMPEMPEAITKHRSVVVTFGPTGSFGYAAAAPLSQQTLGWWSNWPTECPPRSNQVDALEVQKQLQMRHGTWKDPIIQKCIATSSTDRVYPLWTTPTLPHWGERGCVLLGDAAHSLQATSGQGAAQAIEDSVTFSLLLCKLIERASIKHDRTYAVEQSVDAAIRGLYELRHERVARIKIRARNLYFGGRQARNLYWEVIYYCFLLLVTRWPLLGRWIIGNAFTETQEWDADAEVYAYLER
ncbi:hypothetical protein CB0940_10853 [Cercospora beticola]|uniref:FAD-binding domain-containing protein n=1 Tax=Cercospora beticola TaxID=122368 RepID=A0A2G5HU01_CERBT|nr:hypothetical protein CB0940_10853 [Cercospora beticola]PIA96008.1 hypothetical protein CB0940_10853 [Cercospora beticola]WPB07585.1 hypothetical protein RHO25_012246 [Cercospora beticola]